MSKAHKCDRCGTFYEHDFETSDYNTLFIGRRPYMNDFLDLCPKCQKDLENWFAHPTANPDDE